MDLTTLSFSLFSIPFYVIVYLNKGDCSRVGALDDTEVVALSLTGHTRRFIYNKVRYLFTT